MVFHFGKNVRKLRKRRGMDGPAFADLVGISKSTLHRIEHGKSDPVLSTVVAISKALGVPIHELVGKT